MVERMAAQTAVTMVAMMVAWLVREKVDSMVGMLAH